MCIVKGTRLLLGFYLQKEGCHRRWQPSPMSTLDIHICKEWWSPFGVSWGSHQNTFSHQHRLVACSHLQLGSSVVTFDLTFVKRKTRARDFVPSVPFGSHGAPSTSTSISLPTLVLHTCAFRGAVGSPTCLQEVHYESIGYQP